MCLSSRDRKVRYAVGNRTSLHAPDPEKRNSSKVERRLSAKIRVLVSNLGARTAQKSPRPFDRPTPRDRTLWLGRQDSNLGMAESKSDRFSFGFSANSEKISKSVPLLLNRIV